MLSSKLHAERKRMYSSVYSKSTVRLSNRTRSISEELIWKIFKSRLNGWAKNHQPVDMLREARSFGADFITAYIFDINDGTTLQGTRDLSSTLDSFSGILKGVFWVIETPTLVVWLRRLGINLVPQSAFDSQERLEDFCLALCVSAEASLDRALGGEHPMVYAQLRKNLVATGLRGHALQKTIAAELLDQITAAVHGIGTTLMYAMYQLSTHPSLQSILRDDLAMLSDGESILHNTKAIHDLPLLDCILQETLRLYPISPGPLFRITPAQGTRLGLFANIPAGTTVSACSYTLHRNGVFPDPETWQPERWLMANETELKEMKRWFWAFGSGARRCIGDEISIHGKRYNARSL